MVTSRMSRATSRLLFAALLLAGGALGAAYAQGSTPPPNSQNWAQQAAHIIISPWGTIALLTLGCLLIFIDLLTPRTWGIEGSVGVLFVGAVFVSHVMEGSGGWIGVILALAGITLLLLETNVFPGQGIWAIGGLLLLFLGMFASLGGSSHLALALPVSSVLTIVSLIAFFAYLPKTTLWKSIGIEIQQRGTLTVSPMHLSPVVAANVPIDAPVMDYVGRVGTALTPLRPVGMAQFGGGNVPVVTEGEFLESGARIVVTQVDGDRIVGTGYGFGVTALTVRSRATDTTDTA